MMTNTFTKDKKILKVYNSARWKRLRKKQLSLSPLCKNCKTLGRIKEARVADHIKPITKGGEIYNLNNLQSLCISCHNSKSSKEKNLGRVVR